MGSFIPGANEARQAAPHLPQSLLWKKRKLPNWLLIGTSKRNGLRRDRRNPFFDMARPEGLTACGRSARLRRLSNSFDVGGSNPGQQKSPGLTELL